MCLQCITDAIYIKREALPGFALMQAQKDSTEWPKGAYALVECNDPFLILPALPKDPTFGMSEDEEREKSKDPQFSQAYERFYEKAESVIATFPDGDPMWGYSLVSACLQAGYVPSEHGYNVYYWLLNYLAGFLDAPENLHHSHEEPQVETGAPGLTFSDLAVGDRFKVQGAVWTKLSKGPRANGLARKHSAASIAAGASGYGQDTDMLSTFEPWQPVEFLCVVEPKD